MAESRYTVGLDFGTNSVRALIVDVRTGEEVGTHVFDYPSGDAGVIVDPRDPHLARQHPRDYVVGIEAAVTRALAAARDNAGVTPEQVIGIGVDHTGSTPLPVDQAGTPLGLLPEFADNPNAMAWLWKDHTAMDEAEAITQAASELRPRYLAKCGGTYSSEWFWSKLWHCLRTDQAVFDAAHSWVEAADWVPASLAGNTDPLVLSRGVCAAGHKAMYNLEWGGLPDREFLTALDPALGELRERLFALAWPSDRPAGRLCGAWAAKLGLPEGLAICTGGFDAHHGAVGAGVREGTLVKVLGTSSCDMTVAHANPGDVPGVCGVVLGSIVPGLYGIEAGQSAVGDLYAWWVRAVCEGDAKLHEELTRRAEALRPGESGLLALDWNNGNRTILVDPRLTGLLIGQTLHTNRAEVYRALIEATAFGALAILERMEEYGIRVDRVVNCGGIAEKNPFLLQLYADITGREMLISRSAQTCALGAAIFASVVAGPEAGGHATTEEAQSAMTGVRETVFRPNATNRGLYSELYSLYRRLHDAFGLPGAQPLGDVMKRLLEIRGRQARAE